MSACKWWLVVMTAIAVLVLFDARPALSSPRAAFSSASYPLAGGVVEESSPALADLTGDGVPEIIVGTTALDGATGTRTRPTYLAALRGNGSPWFQVQVNAPIKSAPAVGDINSDGYPEIVVTLGGDVLDTDHNGGVMAYTRSGQPFWNRPFYTRDHPSSHDGYTEGVFSSPTLCDVNADGYMEIAFGSWDQRIYLLDYLGRPLWDHPLFDDPIDPGPGFYTADTVWSTAACADLNRDGYKEIIIGGDISSGGVLPDGTRPEDGGYLYIFDKDGDLLVRRYISEAIYSSPAVGDLDRDGDLEIVVGTSYTFWQPPPPDPPPYVYAFDTSEVFSFRSYSDPEKLPYLPGWPQPTAYPGFSSPALADLDGDGDLEVVIGSGKPDGASAQCSNSASDTNCYGAIYAWHHNGAPVSGFPMWPKDILNKNSFIRSSPTIADVDNDGVSEILFAMLWDVIVVGPNGVQEQNLHTTWSIFASPAVGDTDNDGNLEVWIGGGRYEDRSRGYLWRFKSNFSGVGNLSWPMFHHDVQHTGYYPRSPHLTVFPSSVYIMHQYGSAATVSVSLTVANSGDGEITWQVSAVPPNVNVAPLSGAASLQMQSILLSISVANYVTGTYNLGEIMLTATANGREVGGSPARVPVTLYVGRVYRTYLPALLKATK